jgi:hypothetical protein
MSTQRSDFAPVYDITTLRPVEAPAQPTIRYNITPATVVRAIARAVALVVIVAGSVLGIWSALWIAWAAAG